NFAPTNPAVLKRALETGGRSLYDGWRNFVDDLLHNNGRPRQVDTTPFEVGRNLASTPARVVYRSDLIEVLQYLPQTAQVHQVPLLCSPPWINKYYVMDLAPGRSFIEWAVRHGRTVFAISYRNPDASMARTTMDDYLLHGPISALDVVCEITGAQMVDVVGLCLGGTPSFCLSECYLHNRFAKGELELAGQRLDLGDVTEDLYVVAAVNDHIVPWTSSYLTVGHVRGNTRFVLSSGGHIAGIVNPP